MDFFNNQRRKKWTTLDFPIKNCLLFIENKCPNKDVSSHVHSSPVPKMQKVEATHMSIHWWLDKHNVANPHNGILFANKKEWTTDTRHNMGEPCKGYAKSKKPDSKGHVLFNSIYMKYPELANPWRQRAD